MIKQIKTNFGYYLTKEQVNKIKEKLACDLFMDVNNEIFPNKWYKIRFTEESNKNEIFNTEDYKLTIEMDLIPNEYYKSMTFEEICFQPKKKFFTRVKLAFKYIFEKQQIGYKLENNKGE